MMLASPDHSPHSSARSCGYLSLVGTPIGNLSDMSPRAREVLAAADCIVCEDTRVTRRLLNHFDIKAQLVRGDENVLAYKAASLVDQILAGSHLAFVSDAGMPGISDPGQVLCDACLDAGIRVEIIPGPSASVAALAASGLASEHFFFEGFLPRKKSENLERLQFLAHIPATIIVFESPHRVLQTLAHIDQAFGAARVALIREITKLHESCLRGTAQSLIEQISRVSDTELKGECVLVIECAPSRASKLQDELTQKFDMPQISLDEAIAQGLRADVPKSQLARDLARRYGVSKSEIYNKLVSF